MRETIIFATLAAFVTVSIIVQVYLNNREENRRRQCYDKVGNIAICNKIYK